MDVNMLFTI
jgi:hypothetical protein